MDRAYRALHTWSNSDDPKPRTSEKRQVSFVSSHWFDAIPCATIRLTIILHSRPSYICYSILAICLLPVIFSVLPCFYNVRRRVQDAYQHIGKTTADLFCFQCYYITRAVIRSESVVILPYASKELEVCLDLRNLVQTWPWSLCSPRIWQPDLQHAIDMSVHAKHRTRLSLLLPQDCLATVASKPL